MPSVLESLPRICVALGFPTTSELCRVAEREYKDGSKFFEFRLDYLSDPACGIEVIRTFRKSYPDARVLATCRSKQNSGRFSGSIEQQIRILQASSEAGAVAVDLEIESAEQAKSAISRLRKTASLLVSYHNFQNTPRLDSILRRLQRIPADAYKIATMACKPSHNLRLLQFARQPREVPLVALAMSETGTATRVLAPSCGCLFTYAAPSCDEGTAPGQVSAKAMHSLYRCERLTKQTRVYGVIADPVVHSRSPLIHNRAFHARRIDAVYLPFLVAKRHLGDWMTVARALPVGGFSVTIPHKQRVIHHLDIIEPFAKRIGAVNTVWKKGGKWRGTNTDVDGILKPLGRHLRLAHASILIAGYGGAARAAAIALADAGAALTITGRNPESAQALARVAKAQAITLRDAQRNRYDALIHATPVGMFPSIAECLFEDAIPADVVFDMVYNPHETMLLKRAKRQGCTLIYGSEMFLEQAASQFEIWTGESAPRSVMKNALDHHAA